MSLWEIDDKGVLTLNLHPGQARAWQSTAREVYAFAGTQGGKTSFIPWWLWREIGRCGPGDYLAATATFDLFKLKFLPEMLEVFEHILRIGRYWASARVIELADPETGRFWANKADEKMWGRIILRSAESKGGLESNTANAAVLDECGQDSFTLETYEAVRRRLSLRRGRIFGGTTLYNLGWLKNRIYDKWRAGGADIEIIQFDSTENPSFPVEEYLEARRDMPRWRFDMFYRGRFSRPAGLIYDSFDPAKHKVKPFTIPEEWPRFLGLDFGGVHTAALFYALDPESKRYYLYREYLAGGRTAKEHTHYLLRGERGIPFAVGGSHSEEQWRDEFRSGGEIPLGGARVKVPGLPIREPDVKEVEVGINRVYGAHKRDQIIVFNTLDGYLQQKESYSRKVNEKGEVLEDIENKSAYHFMDAERYIIGWVMRAEKDRRIRGF
jgi:hypothetical protein